MLKQNTSVNEKVFVWTNVGITSTHACG